MRRMNLRLFWKTTCGLVLISLSSVACTPASPSASSPAETLASEQSREVSAAGAWSPSDPFAPDVQEAARFAVQTLAVQNKSRILYKDVQKAHQQVVAGLHYQLDLQVTQDGIPRIVHAKVWRKLDGRYALTEWAWLDR